MKPTVQSVDAELRRLIESAVQPVEAEVSETIAPDAKAIPGQHGSAGLRLKLSPKAFDALYSRAAKAVHQLNPAMNKAINQAILMSRE